MFLGLRHAFLHHAGMRDEAPRMSAWEAVKASLYITHNDIVLLIVVFVERVNRDNSCHGTRLCNDLAYFV